MLTPPSLPDNFPAMNDEPVPPQGFSQPPLPPPPPDPWGPEPVGPSEAGASGMDVGVFIAGLGGLLASLGFCCCGLVIIVSLPAGLFAWIAGSMERRRCREQGRQPHGLLVAGWILGIIATALSAAWLAFMLIYLLAVGTMFSLESLQGR